MAVPCEAVFPEMQKTKSSDCKSCRVGVRFGSRGKLVTRLWFFIVNGCACSCTGGQQGQVRSALPLLQGFLLQLVPV